MSIVQYKCHLEEGKQSISSGAPSQANAPSWCNLVGLVHCHTFEADRRKRQKAEPASLDQKRPPFPSGMGALKSRLAPQNAMRPFGSPGCRSCCILLRGYSLTGTASGYWISASAPSTRARPSSLSMTRSIGRPPNLSFGAFMNEIAASRPRTSIANRVASPWRRAAAGVRRTADLRNGVKRRLSP